MPFPDKNNIFQKGNFEGYKVYGRCRIAQSFFNDKTGTVKPVHGKNMAVLDDPNHIGSDGMRLSLDDIPPNEKLEPSDEPFFDSSHILFNNSSGQVTKGSDGACLEIEGVAIKPGQQIIIHFNFLRNDSRPDMNDFAMLEICDAENGRIAQDLMAQSNAMKTPDGLILWSRGWQTHVWTNLVKRKINLRIIVSNAYFLSNQTGSLQIRRSKALPSGLLVDGVFLI